MISFGGTPLADNEADGFDGAEGVRVGSRPTVQATPVIDSVAPSIQHRGNVSYFISFRSRRRHASVEAAKLFCGTHATAMAAAAGTFNGFGLSLDNAWCEVQSEIIGLTTQSSYSITGAHNPG